jgi:hypothetical protein
MNQKKITATSKQTQLIAVTIIAALAVTATTIIGINNGQQLQKAMAQEVKAVTPNQSTNKEFWINTVHLDGMTNIHPGVKCDTCAQNTPTHPAEQPPVNSTIPTGGGFRITAPNKVGAWDFRSFTFSPDQIVVNQGDK